MTKIRFLRSRAIQQLTNDVSVNLERYRAGDFDFLEADPANYFESSHEIDEVNLAQVTCTADSHREVECCMAIFNAMGTIPPSLARDSRIWIYLTHTALLKYARTRWPIPSNDEQAEAHIRKHFFAIGTRGIERDNAASRLWWMAALCNRVEGLTLEESLKAFLHQYDVRANIIERPTTAQSIPVFSAIIKRLHVALTFKDESVFKRERFRAAMKQLNLQGGVKLFGVLSPTELNSIIEDSLK